MIFTDVQRGHYSIEKIVICEIPFAQGIRALSLSLFFLTCLLELLRELAEDLLLVEELALVAVLKVLRDPLPHVPWQLPVNWAVFGSMPSLCIPQELLI